MHTLKVNQIIWTTTNQAALTHKHIIDFTDFIARHTHDPIRLTTSRSCHGRRQSKVPAGTQEAQKIKSRELSIYIDQSLTFIFSVRSVLTCTLMWMTKNSCCCIASCIHPTDSTW